MGYYLTRRLDFQRHNEEAERVWRAYHSGNPYRVPVTLSGSITNLLCNPEINRGGYSFKDFYSNPQVQIEAQLDFLKWWRYNLLCDSEMGPLKKGWQVSVNFQNSYEAGWFGCPLVFSEGVVPDVLPILQQDKRRLYGLAPPDPLRGNLYARVMEFFEYMQDRCPKMEFEGLPVLPPDGVPGESTDGPFTVACKLRGLTEACLDIYEDPKYLHDLTGFVTDNTVRRIRAIKEWRWDRKPDSKDRGQYRTANWAFADDAIAMLSPGQYREFVFPYHRKLVDAFSDGGHVSIHLCGDATHHFRFLKENLKVYSFDTGFPVDFGKLRRELGPDVQIYGGPSVTILKYASADAVRQEVKRICGSGIMEGGRFVLREANNLAPGTPIENVEAMYDAANEFGRYV